MPETGSRPSGNDWLRLWLRTSWRHWTGHPLQTATVVAILALGVASFLSIRLANRAAVAGFAGFSESLTGGGDLTLEAPADRFETGWLPELRELLAGRPVEIAPVVERAARALGPDDRLEIADAPGGPPGAPVRLLGLDLVGIQNLDRLARSRPIVEAGGDRDLWQLLRGAPEVFVAPGLADRLGGADHFELLLDGRIHPVRLAGRLPPSRRGVDVPDSLAVIDLSGLRSLTGSDGTVTRVELALPDGPAGERLREEVAELLEAAADGRWFVVRAGGREAAGEAMTRAFRLNLTVLSLISLVVGIYLIIQALDAAVIRRRREIGVLKALGLSAREVTLLWSIDLVVLGLLGGLLGTLGGWLAAQAAVVAVARTVNDLYMATSAASAGLTVGDWIAGTALALFGSLVAGAVPVFEASRTQPARVLASGRHENGPARPLPLGRIAAVLLVLAFLAGRAPAVLLEGGGRFPLFGYLSALCWILGGSLAGAALIGPLARAAHRAWRGRPVLHLALARLRLPSKRHRLAAGGLLVAVAMAASMSILIGSFEGTVTRWLESRFQADLYIASRGFTGAASVQRMEPATVEVIEATPGVAAVSPLRFLRFRYQGAATFIAGMRTSLIGERERFLWIDPLRPLEQMPAGADAWAVANETFCNRFGHAAGDRIPIDTPAGPRRLWLRGVKADYGNEQGLLLVDEAELEAWFGGGEVSNVSVYAAVGTDPVALAAGLRMRFPGLAVRTQGELLASALQTFRETFAVTHALKLLGLSVALAGLALALVNLLREDRPTLATLHALGLQRGELAAVTAVEGGFLGAVAAGGGLALSLVLGHLLVFVINYQSFGWTLQYSVPAAELALQAAGLVAAGATVGWTVGWAYGRVRPEQEE